MAKAAKVKIRVSTQPVVLMEAEVARKIRQHARGSMKAEVCGVLIGNTEHERLVVEACIAGNNAAQGGAHVTFTQDTWEHIYKVKDKEYPEQKIVGWYHSHPGFGVFLSEHDLFIQQNFFSNPQQVAWVYDPHTDEEGCFGWVGDKIEKLTSIRVGYSQSVDISADPDRNDYEEEAAALDPRINLREERAAGEPAWVRWMTLTLGYLAAILLGAVIGFFFRPQQTASPDTDGMRIIAACRQIRWQSPLCQDILVQLAPAPMPGPPPSQAQEPQTPPPEKAPAQKGNNGKH